MIIIIIIIYNLIELTSLWFDPGLVGLFITSTLLHLGEDINLLVVSTNIVLNKF